MSDCRAMPVANLLPHSSPMVLIDRIIDYSNSSLVAEVNISKDSMFFDETLAGVPAWAGIEYMAQSISALAGTHAVQNKTEIKIGFLLGTRMYNIRQRVFAPGKTLRVEVDEVFRDESGLASFACRILCDAELWVESRINVFEVDDINNINRL